MAKKEDPVFEVETGKTFPTGISTQVDWEPSTNIIECKDLLIIEVELPGVNKKDASVLLQNNKELIIRGIKKKPSLQEPQVTYYLFEREFGHFQKRILIDFMLDTSNITSTMEDGVLTIKIPKKKIAKISVDIE